MSLAFLAKKSWHSTNINNQEKVWLRQQEQEREKKKLELLQKQMKEEREIEEMRAAAGQARPAEKLNWMYSQPISLNTDDEYLMGKEKEPEQEDEELKKVVTNKGVSAAFVEKQADPARAWRDDMNKIRDDPLLAIKQAEKKARERIMDNPLKIAQFKEDLEKKRLAKEEKKAMKKAAKKAAKREKKHAKGKRSDSSDDEAERRQTALDPSFLRGAGTAGRRDWDRDKDGRADRDQGKGIRVRGSSRDRSPHQKRSRSPSRDRGRDHQRRSRSRSRERARDRSRSSERGRDRSRERPRDAGRSIDSGRQGQRERSRDRQRAADGTRDRDRRREQEEGEGGKEKVGKAFPTSAKDAFNSKFGYGLWRGEGAEPRQTKEKDDYDPRAVKRMEKTESYSFGGRKGIIDNGAEAARKHHAQTSKLSEEERKAALAQMMGNAAMHDSHRGDRIRLAEEALAREKAKADQGLQAKDAELEFQSKLNKEAFMDSATTMAERLQQRKHYRERLGDDD